MSWWKWALICAAALPLFATSIAGARGTWISDPVQPGSSQPPVGRSLFDYLFTETDNGELKYAIPFPFSRLVKRIEQQLAETSAANGGIPQVLIPMGRSLVRNAARPDYFSSSRLVLAVDAPPRFDPDHAGLMLKDRLYIGYMEQDQLLEVISYNEAAGRFEFQLVQDYGPGEEPKVRYANRQLCIACHQNAAPIFSRQQWDETNANPAIDDLLERQGARRYGVSLDAGVDIPFAIDSATDRANYYSYYQLMWQEGCKPLSGDPDSTGQAAIHCRAALLRAALQFLLTDGAGFDTDSGAYREDFWHFIQANVARRWPEGLLVSDPDIPNRNPLLKLAGHSVVDGAGMPSANVIGEVFDPLVLRAPLKWLDAGSDSAMHLLVAGLAGFLAESDRQRLDQHLFVTGMEQQLVKQQQLSCSLQEKAWKEPGRRFGFDCHTIADAGTGPVNSLRGRFTLEQGRVSQATINHLSLTDGTGPGNLAIRQVVDGSEKGVLRFGIYNGSLHARLPDGNALGDLVLEWQGGMADSTAVSAHLSVLTDFSLLDTALRNLVQQAGADLTDALSALPFRRASIMPALFGQLGMHQPDWCCINSGAMPAITVETMKYHQEFVGLKPFYQYCAACHASASAFPANFLYGDEAQVRQQVSHCAERIYYRLSMLQKNPGDRGKSPMPPPLALKMRGYDEAAWTDSGVLEALKGHVERLLLQSEGRPDIREYERRGFDQLRSCLPAEINH